MGDRKQPTPPPMRLDEVGAATMLKLGDRVKDRISGLKGIVIGRTEWLYGCLRVTVQPEESKDGKPAESFCIDEAQAELVKPSVIEGFKVALNRTLQQQPAGPMPSARRQSDPTR